MSTERNAEGIESNWKGLINESVHTSDDEDIGDVAAVNRDFVVVKRGFRKTHYYYIPQSQIEGWDGNVLWLKSTEEEIKHNYERNTAPNPARYYSHARTTIQSPPYDTLKLPELRILQERYAEPSSTEFTTDEPSGYRCDLCLESYGAEDELSNHVVGRHGESALGRTVAPAVVDWDSVVHKNVRSKEGQAVGNIGGVTDQSVVIMQGPGREFVVPKAHVEAFDGAELRLDLPYNEMEAHYKRIAD